MAYDANQIIRIQTRIRPTGLGFANFATAVLFAAESELPAGFNTDTFRTYNSLTALSADFATSTQVYIAANRWLGGIPATRQLIVYGRDDTDADWATTLNKARNQIWWYWSFFSAATYNAEAQVLEIAAWHESNGTYFQNCQTGANATAIRDENVTNDIASQLTTLGYRYTSTFAHATDAYAGIALCKWFAAVNYSAENSTITGEYKKLSGVASESLTDSQYAAMNQASKKCQFYTTVDLQGSEDVGRVINSRSHSSFGEFMDDVVNLSAFTNNLTVNLYNSIANQTDKLGQEPVGQAVLIDTVNATCEQYITNGYLGPRIYLDPDDGIEKFTRGYENLSAPEDILSISDPDRDGRKSAPLRTRIFRRGAIHAADIDVEVF